MRNALVVGTVIALGGCLTTFGGPTATITSITPAHSNAAAQLRDIAVLPFEGSNGKDFSVDLEGMIASIQLGETPYFHVAERQKLDPVLKEIKFSQSGIVSKEQGLRLGKLLGIKGFYTGFVSSPTTHESPYQETRSVCVEEDSKKGPFNLSKCKRSTESKVTCYKREAIYSFTPKLVEIESGKIVYSNNIKGSASTDFCPDQSTPTPTLSQLLESAKTNAIANFRKEIAPSYTSINVKLMNSSDDVADEFSRRKLNQGMEFAKGQRFDRACELWQEIDPAIAHSPSVFFNQGVCAEMSGDFVKASDLYKKADRLLDKPDDQISAALSRVEKTRRDVLQVGKQLH